MKSRVKVWTLAWDDNNGTDCRVFGSETEWLSYFKGIILQDIAGIQARSAQEIRRLLSENMIGDAYELWQATYKDGLDTYNWSCDEIEVELSQGGISLAA